MERDEHSSKSRLLAAAKTLFAEKGYEATAIADITRAAKTSHSQFLKYYSSKEELRTEIIEQQWSELNKTIILAIAGVPSPTEKLTLALNVFVSLLERDAAFRTILLLENAATRDDNGLTVTPEFREFVLLIDEIVRAMKDDGELLPTVNTQALRSALLGSVEGMMRERLFRNFPAEYSTNDVRSTLAVFIESACDMRRPSVMPGLQSTTRSSEDEWIHYYLKLGDKALSPSELS